MVKTLEPIYPLPTPRALRYSIFFLQFHSFFFYSSMNLYNTLLWSDKLNTEDGDLRSRRKTLTFFFLFLWIGLWGLHFFVKHDFYLSNAGLKKGTALLLLRGRSMGRARPPSSPSGEDISGKAKGGRGEVGEVTDISLGSGGFRVISRLGVRRILTNTYIIHK